MKKLISGFELFFLTMMLAISTALTVNISAQVDNSKFVTQSVPDRMSPGQAYNLIVTFENTGTTSWAPGDYKLRLTSTDGKTPAWTGGDMDLVKIIEPGNTASFELKVTAPSTEGIYPFIAQLMRNGNLFGESNKAIDVTISPSVGVSDMLNSSAFVQQTVPQEMEIGKPYKVMVSMTNTGKTTWTPGNYRLIMLDAAGGAYTGANWGTYSVGIDENISPGGTKVFNFDVVPTVDGNFSLQWRMATGDNGMFGDASNVAVVTVNKIEEPKNVGKEVKK